MKRAGKENQSPNPTAKRAKGGKNRGLLIRGEQIKKFFATKNAKTHEIRNFNLRCVKPGNEVFLLECGVKDSAGRGVFKIWGKALFEGNTFVNHEDIMQHKDKHRCTKAEYDALIATWQSNKGGCNLWSMNVTERFDPPLYIAPRQGEEGGVWRLDSLIQFYFDN